MSRSSRRKTAAKQHPNGRRRESGPASTSSPRALRSGVFLALLAIIAAVAWLLVPAARVPAPPGPFVLVSIDTLRADHLPAYGYKGVETPAIDALAADGVLFEHAYAHTPQTLPSHTSILSGELPFEHGVRDNVGFVVKAGQRLLPGMLREAGYATAGFASAFILRKATGISQGFQVYDSNMEVTSPGASVGMVRRDGAKTLELAEKWLSRQTSPRFFLFVHFYEPHKPYRPPARYAHYPNPYDGTIAYSDELVGRLMTDLKTRRLYEKATIALLSDHGEGLGDHGEQEHGVFLYDETIHVPLIIKLPEDRDAGKRVSSPVEHIDLVPTLLDLAGVPIPHDLRGRSLRAAMDGSDPSLADRGLYAETLYPLYHFGWSPLYALTDLRYRFIKAPRAELYDLDRDPAEERNLASLRPQTAASMEAALDRLADQKQVERPSGVSAADLERFQALGYIGSSRMPVVASPGAQLPDPKDKIAVLEGYREGVNLRNEGRLPEAAAAFRRVLVHNPSMVDVWVQLSAVLTQEGDTAQAVEALERVVHLDPSLSDSQLALADAEIRLGHPDEAAAHARAALKENPAGGHEILARVALAQGNEVQALAEARLALQADPTLPLPLYIEGMSLKKAGRDEEALARFRSATDALKAHKVKMTDLHRNIADTLVHMERYGEAEAEFKEEIAEFPKNDRARVGLAMLYRAQGRLREANEVLLAMLEASPTADTYALAARTLQALGEPDQARQVLERGRTMFPRAAELGGRQP
jgi:choline-sulfatase